MTVLFRFDADSFLRLSKVKVPKAPAAPRPIQPTLGTKEALDIAINQCNVTTNNDGNGDSSTVVMRLKKP